MHILITNDDGYDAPGLVALHAALRDIAEVTVAAPAVCHSSKGHAVCTREVKRVREHRHAEMGPIYSIDASPADCVRIGVEQLTASRPDLVVAGINPGANLGVDVYYSGTVAAAREAAIMGFPAFAVSTYMRRDVDLSWPDKSELTTKTLLRLIDAETKPGQFWNINFPAIPPGEKPKPLVFTRQSTEPQGVAFEADGEPNAYRFSGDYNQRPANQDADVRAVFDGHISASLLQLDTSLDVSETLAGFGSRAASV